MFTGFPKYMCKNSNLIKIIVEDYDIISLTYILIILYIILLVFELVLVILTLINCKFKKTQHKLLKIFCIYI